MNLYDYTKSIYIDVHVYIYTSPPTIKLKSNYHFWCDGWKKGRRKEEVLRSELKLNTKERQERMNRIEKKKKRSKY